MTWFLLGLFVLGIVGYVAGKIEQRERGAVVHLGRWGWIVVVGAIAVIILSLANAAKAADPERCHALGLQVGVVVKAATNDTDLEQTVAVAAEAHCIVVDELPVVIRIEAPPGTVPAAGDPSAGAGDAKTKWCKAHYGSFRVSDGTVLRRKGGSRVACPWPG